MVCNNLGISGVQRIFNMVYIMDYTEKDIQGQRNFAIILIQADLLSQIIIKSLDPLRVIHKKEVGPYHGFGY